MLQKTIIHKCLRYLAIPLYLCGRVLAASETDTLPLIELIQQLNDQGFKIIYSNDLVHSRMNVSVDSISIEVLRKAVEKFGLSLKKQESVYIITLNDTAATNEPVIVPVPDKHVLLEHIIVTGSVHRFPKNDLAGSSYRFSSQAMSQVPSLGSDAMRITTRLPGTSSVGVSAKPRIRGGLQDELLVLRDGVELLEPFHLADYHSAYSAIDHQTIESIDIYTGGFPSRYGNRMSGVMDITSLRTQLDYPHSIGVSTFSSFINTSGEAGEQYPSRWMISYRQGDLGKLTEYLQTRAGDPRYEDFSSRINIALDNDSELTLGGALSEDNISFSDLEERAASDVDSYYVWSRFDTKPNDSLKTSLSVSFIDFKRRKQLFSQEEPAADEELVDPTKGGFLDYSQEVERFAIRNDYTALLKRGNLLEFGWQLEYGSADYRNISVIDRGELADLLGTEREINRNLQLDPEGISGGLYTAIEIVISENFLLQPSIRWDFQDYYVNSNEQQLSPRLGMAYEINDTTRLRLSLGRFCQPQGIQELAVLDGETRFNKPQESDQLIAGIEWRRQALQITSEFYFKSYRVQKKRHENMFNPFVLLPEMEPDRVALSPEDAIARGFDLDAVYAISEVSTVGVRYSYMKAIEQINSVWVPRRWSQQHTVNALYSWHQDDASFSLAINWHTGWRTSRLPESIPEDTVIPIEQVLNNDELPSYFSLDINLRKSWRIGDNLLQFYADFTNVTERENVAGIDYDIEEQDTANGIIITPIPDQEALLSMVTSIGATLSF